MKIIKLRVDEEYNNVRDYLLKLGLGKAKIHELYMNKLVKIDGVVSNFHEKINPKSKIEINLTSLEKIDFEPFEKELDVVYEDDYILIVNKPKNMIIYPGDNEKDTLSNVVANYYLKTNQNCSVRYIHRIDKDTTGLVIFTKDILTNAIMDQMLRENKIKRTYLAYVYGRLKERKGTIKLAIGKDRHEKNKYMVVKDGELAITSYEEIGHNNLYSWLKVNLETGKTHQIRVHFSSLNHPLLGDVLYGGAKTFISRPALHSIEVEFIHPYTKEYLKIECPYPDDFKSL